MRVRFLTGFTYIEIVVALAIVALIAAIGMSVLVRFDRAIALDAETQRVAALVKDAHDRTLASEGGTNFGAHLEEDSVTLFRGSSYNPAAPQNDVFALRRGVTLAHALQGGGSDIIFMQIKGTTAQEGTITVSAFGENKIIDVSATGVIGIR